MRRAAPRPSFVLLAGSVFAAVAAAGQAVSPAPPKAPAAPPVIEGTVKAPDGKPLEKALVIVRSVAGASMTMATTSDPPITARTDAQGRFRIALGKPGLYDVRIEAVGLASQTLDRVKPGTPLLVTLQKGGVIEGRVRDGATGAVVRGARVEAREERETGRTPLNWEAGAGVVQTRTDTQGAFRLEGLARGLHTVTAYTRGFGRAQRGSVALGARVDLYLFGGASLSGTVRDGNNRPVAAAQVRFEPELPFGARAAAGVETTDAQGRFEFLGLAPGTYRVAARHKDFAPAWVSGIAVEKGGEAHADLVVQAGSVITGRLVGSGERPVPGRVTVQENEGGGVPRSLAEVLRTEAGADGRFRLKALPPGAYVLGVNARGQAPQRVNATVNGREPTVDVGDVILETGLTIVGRVRDKAGLPVPDARVTANRMGRMMLAMGGPAEGRTEADGSFVVAGLEPGGYQVNVYATGYGQARKDAEAGAQDVDVVLQAAGSISGSVVDEGGRPVESFRVIARASQRPAPGLILPGRSESVTSADGRFLLSDVSEGEFTVEASAPEYMGGSVSNVKVTAGNTTDAGRVVLRAGGVIKGLVLDGAGGPVAGASVSSGGQGMAMLVLGPSGTVTTDVGGAFEMRGVSPGTAQIVARHPNYAQGYATVEVDPAKGPAEARLTLLQGGRVEGRSRRRDGSGITGTMVQVAPIRPGGGIGFDPSETITTGADGSFVAEHVPAGRANVILMSRTGTNATAFENMQNREVDVREGETTSVEFVSRDILVSGRVTRSGAPAPGLRVSFSGGGQFRTIMMSPGGGGAPAPTGPQRLTGVTGEDGSYQLLVDEPGKFTVSVESVDGRTSFPRRTVDVPDADSHVADIAFAGVTVSGVVLDKETEQPVARAFVVFAVKEKGTPSSSLPPMPSSMANVQTGLDGRFQVDLDAGEHTATARAEGYSPERVDVSVGPGGAGEVRLLLSRGLAISGRVVDAAGRPVGSIMVSATQMDRSTPGSASSGIDISQSDGAFQVTGLGAVPHMLAARSDTGAFAILNGVTPSDKPVALTLRPGGRVMVSVRGPDGTPVSGVRAMVSKVGGVAGAVVMPSASSDAEGKAEIFVPAGTVVELSASKDELAGTTTASVPAGGVAAATITLAPRPRGGNP